MGQEWIDYDWYKKDGVYIYDRGNSYIRVWWDTSDPNHHCWWGRGRTLHQLNFYQNCWKHYELDLSKLGNRNQRDDALKLAPYVMQELYRQGY